MMRAVRAKYRELKRLQKIAKIENSILRDLAALLPSKLTEEQGRSILRVILPRPAEYITVTVVFDPEG